MAIFLFVWVLAHWVLLLAARSTGPGAKGATQRLAMLETLTQAPIVWQLTSMDEHRPGHDVFLSHDRDFLLPDEGMPDGTERFRPPRRVFRASNTGFWLLLGLLCAGSVAMGLWVIQPLRQQLLDEKVRLADAEQGAARLDTALKTCEKKQRSQILQQEILAREVELYRHQQGWAEATVLAIAAESTCQDASDAGLVEVIRQDSHVDIYIHRSALKQDGHLAGIAAEAAGKAIEHASNQAAGVKGSQLTLTVLNLVSAGKLTVADEPRRPPKQGRRAYHHPAIVQGGLPIGKLAMLAQSISGAGGSNRIYSLTVGMTSRWPNLAAAAKAGSGGVLIRCQLVVP